jgi:O-antigen/teichoic acid export membrane protein
MNLDLSAGAQLRLPLMQRVLRAGAWTMFGYGTHQLLRLAGNLVLTRLLFPEAFGLMAIVQAVMVGVAMFSDVGIEQSIIQNKSGNDHAFLNTAWTMKVMRGVLMWIALCVLAYPIASFYSEPLLAQLLPVGGLAAVIAGFGSTKIASADRNLGIARTTVIDVGSYAFGLLVTIVWAWIDRSIWSLVMGNLVGVAARTIASHVWLDGIRNRFSWQPKALAGLVAFGRWIFVSSVLTFLAGDGNRLLIGGLLDVRLLAFFTLAAAIDQVPQLIAQSIGGRVLFPAYSEVVRERPERLFAAVEKARLITTVPCWLVYVFLVYFGDSLMQLLYDDRYRDSGWMLQILGLGSLVGSLIMSYNGILWAKGMVRTSTALLAIQLLIQVPAMVIGNYLAGPHGLVLAFAAALWILYPAYAFVYWRLSLWQPKLDLPLIGASSLIAMSVLGHKGLW